MVDLTPYSTAKPFLGVLPTFVSPLDAERISAYQLYESMYRNVPEAFRLVQRGSDASPIYIPSAKTLIEAKNRYLAKRWNFSMDPRLGTPAEQEPVIAALTTLFRREQMYTKFSTQKRYGLIRGDSVWHIVADPLRPEGKRISIYERDPASYFPIDDPFNPDKIMGVHLVEQVLLESGGFSTKRQTYRKQPTGTITYELSWWEVGAWDDREGSGHELKPAKEIPLGDHNKPVKETALPPLITSLPVYHIKNSRTPSAQFGSSELQGFERIIAGVNQAISDEELTLALEGLGLYATTSGPPVDDDGVETTWKIGPGYVVEIDQDTDFKRVTGVSSVKPVLDHIAYLEKSMREAAGVPDIAIGSVDVQTAESGIALAFKMAPILAGNEEKEQEILGVMDHMLYDLTAMWLPAFEGLPVTIAQAVSVVDDPMPVNRQQVLDEVVQLLSTDPPLISAEYARTVLSEKLGYEFTEEIGESVVLEATALAKARNTDPFNARVNNELADAQSAL